MRYLISIFCYLFLGSPLLSQTVKGVVADQITRLPISDVFVFFDNSSSGDITDESGQFSLPTKELQNPKLIFSHLNYELFSVTYTSSENWPDTLFLESRDVILTEAVVVEKAKPKIRLRWYKRFVGEFFGEDYDRDLIKIKNPEVLIFDEKKGRLTAATNEPLLIDNRVLGYKIHFFLESYESYKYGELSY